jgi:membrane-bound ClpP family serine protease
MVLPSGLQLIQGFSNCITVGHHTLHLAVSHSQLLPLPWLWHWVLLTTIGLLVIISKAELHLFKS